MNIAIVVPHIFMDDKFLDKNIFAPGKLAIELSNSLLKLGHYVTLFSSGPIKRCNAKIISLKPQYLYKELRPYNENIREFIKLNLKTFHQLLNIVEKDIINQVKLNEKKFDIIHIYQTNSAATVKNSEILCKPTIFTIHDPFSRVFELKKTVKILKKQFLSISQSQQEKFSNKFLSTIYHGIDVNKWDFSKNADNYFIFYGRIIKEKGPDDAIKACLAEKQKLKICGLEYEGHGGDNFFSKKVLPFIDNKTIDYLGFLNKQKQRNKILSRAKALLFPAKWNEPFGMTVLEANSCGTPVIAYKKGALKEIIKDGVNGFLVNNIYEMRKKMKVIDKIDRKKCRKFVEKNFSIEKMAKKHEEVYEKIIEKS